MRTNFRMKVRPSCAWKMSHPMRKSPRCESTLSPTITTPALPQWETKWRRGSLQSTRTESSTLRTPGVTLMMIYVNSSTSTAPSLSESSSYMYGHASTTSGSTSSTSPLFLYLVEHSYGGLNKITNTIQTTNARPLPS